MYVTYLLLALTILISARAINDNSLKSKLMLNPYDVIHNKNWYRCITHGFIHADYTHLIFNMIVLFMFGEALEKRLVGAYELKGHFYFAVLYLTGILFSCLYSLQKYKDSPGYNSLGASGATMAVLFAYIILFPTTKLAMFLVPIPIYAYYYGPIILLIEYLLSKRGGTGIAHDAHIAGAIFGVIFITVLDYHYLIDFFKNFG
ncbi:MAG: rhomboid family intramembrane serine protease [Crocinitomix sp.]|nr:rhomboid family intramembrane serine protease [Crocinitomix sp.]